MRRNLLMAFTGLGFRVWGLEFRVFFLSLGFRIWPLQLQSMEGKGGRSSKYKTRRV